MDIEQEFKKFVEEFEKEASSYRDKEKDDEKKRKFAFGGKKKSRHGASGYGKGEEVEEASKPAIQSFGKKLSDYAKKSGGIDKDDFKFIAKEAMGGHLPNPKSLQNMDTEPREVVLDLMAKEFGRKEVEKEYGTKFTNPKNYKEWVELEEAIDPKSMYKRSLEILADENDKTFVSDMSNKGEKSKRRRKGAILKIYRYIFNRCKIQTHKVVYYYFPWLL